MSLIFQPPGDLVLRENVRRDTAADRGLIESIRERGVLQPITAYRDEATEDLVVLTGNRRTLAAVEAGATSVPVYVVDAPAEADRITDQLSENEHRSGLATRDRVEALQQLALIGLSARDICQRVAQPLGAVCNALAVAESESHRALMETRPELTLDQLAALLEFEDEPEIHERLAKSENFDRDIAIEQKARARVAERQALIAALRVADVEVIVTGSPWEYVGWGRDGITAIAVLRDGDEPLDPKAHESCPGRVIIADELGFHDPRECCRYDGLHQHAWDSNTSSAAAQEMDPEEAERLAAEKAARVERQERWEVARDQRRAFAQSLMGGKAPKGWEDLALHALAAYHVYADDDLLEPWAGATFYNDDDEFTIPAAATPSFLAFAWSAAAFENSVPGDIYHGAWMSKDSGTYWLRWLEAHGYELSPIEREWMGGAGDE